MEVQSSGHTTFATPSAPVVGAEDDASYRTVSVLALVSLVLGLAAPLCLIAPLLYAIPIAGAAISILAIGRIAESGGALIGRKAAVIAIALCVASASAAIARSTLSNYLLSRQARQTALEWMSLLQDGDAEKAFELTAASTAGPPAPPPVNSPDASSGPPPDPIDQFRENPVVKYLLTGGRSVEVNYVEDLGFDPGRRGESRIRQQYFVSGSEQSSSQPEASVQLTLQRTRIDSPVPSRWLVSDYQSDELSGPHEPHDPHEHH